MQVKRPRIKTKPYSLRIHPELMERVEVAAQTEERTVSNWIRTAIVKKLGKAGLALYRG